MRNFRREVNAKKSMQPPAETPDKPWPLSWVAIAILIYILLRTLVFLFSD
jgi:hypothetical protein